MNGRKRFLSLIAVLISTWILVFSSAHAVVTPEADQTKTASSGLEDCE